MSLRGRVYLVEHVHTQDDGEEDVKLVGVYSSEEGAQNAIERARLLPGFRDTPDGFVVNSYSLDEDHWTSGYRTIHHQSSTDDIGS